MKSLPGRLPRLAPVALLFAVLLSFTTCKKNPPPPPPAKGSLLFEGALCNPYTVHGTYYNGVPAADTNYVEINVNVTSPGSYNITTDTANGVRFSASGVFTGTGMKAVHLKSTGAFLDHTYADFHTTFDSTHCGFRVNISDSAERSIANNTWQFTAGGHFYQGPGIAFGTPYVGGSFFVYFFGSMPGYSDTSLTIKYAIFANRPVSCSYPTDDDWNFNAFHFNTSRFAPGPRIVLDASPSTVPAVIDIFNCSSNVYYFNGTARDSAGNIIPVTNARFRADTLRAGPTIP